MRGGSEAFPCRAAWCGLNAVYARFTVSGRPIVERDCAEVSDQNKATLDEGGGVVCCSGWRSYIAGIE